MKLSSILTGLFLVLSSAVFAEEPSQLKSIKSVQTGLQTLQTRKAEALDSRISQQLDKMIELRLEQEASSVKAPAPRTLQLSVR